MQEVVQLLTESILDYIQAEVGRVYTETTNTVHLLEGRLFTLGEPPILTEHSGLSKGTQSFSAASPLSH